MQNEALVLSPHVGVFSLSRGMHVLWHVLGRTFAIVNDVGFEAVRRFDVAMTLADFTSS